MTHPTYCLWFPAQPYSTGFLLSLFFFLFEVCVLFWFHIHWGSKHCFLWPAYTGNCRLASVSLTARISHLKYNRAFGNWVYSSSVDFPTTFYGRCVQCRSFPWMPAKCQKPAFFHAGCPFLYTGRRHCPFPSPTLWTLHSMVEANGSPLPVPWKREQLSGWMWVEGPYRNST